MEGLTSQKVDRNWEIHFFFNAEIYLTMNSFSNVEFPSLSLHMTL